MKSVQSLLAAAPRKRLLAVAIASSLAATGAMAQQFKVDSNAAVEPVLNQRVVEKQPRSRLQLATPTYYIIQLEAPSAVMYHGGMQGLRGTSTQATGTEKFVAQSADVSNYQNFLMAEQSKVASQIQSKFPNAKIERQLNLTMNGLIISVMDDTDIKAQLAAIPGVKRVFDNEIHTVDMDASLDLIEAPAVWEQLGGRAAAGAGVKLAVVDTGINEEHPMFQSSGASPIAGQFDDYCTVTDPTFCNDKIILARSYMTESFLAGAAAGETLGPKDFNGHGSHVAGTAVGKVITTEIGGIATTLSGVAPGAGLMSYKACYETSTGQGSCPTVMTIAALEDALSDGADVINNSWGGGAGSAPENSAHKSVIEALNEAGVLVVFSAGNSGPGAQTIGCPSCVEDTLTVANTRTGRVFEGSVVTGGETFVSYEGSNTTITAPLEFELTAAVVADPNNALACDPFAPGTFNGEAVFTERGACAFTVKANNIADAGGAAMILANNTSGVIIMSMDAATIPGVSISQADGATLLANWTAGDMVTLNPEQAKVYPENVDVLANSSSRGPNGNPSFMKPEIAAPGTDILSASPEGSALRLLSGTSMAGPHVAGAAALMKQIYGLDSDQLKSILMTSTVGGVRKQDGTTPADAFDVGAGRLDVTRAANVAVTVDKPSMTNNACSIGCSFDRVITDISGEATDWSVAVTFTDSDISATANVAAVSVPANGSVTLSVDVDSRWASEAWKFGQVKLTSADGYSDVVIPIVIMPKRSDDVSVVSVANVGGTGTAAGDLVMSAKAALGSTGEDVTLTIDVPVGAVFDEESIAVESVLATEVSRELSADGRTFTLVSTQTDDPNIATLEDTTATFPFTGFSLFANNLGSSLCTAGCDEQVYTFNLGANGIIVDGRMVSTITLGMNGLNAIDSQAGAFGTTFANSAIPTAAVPNGLFAPMWTDLELQPANNALIRYAALTDGAGNPWFVWEWVNANVYDDTSGELYTFSIWYKRNSDEIYYNYIDMGAAPEFATVGVESADGTFGLQSFYDGEGTFPTSGTSVRAYTLTGDKASVNVEYTLDVPFLAEAADVNLTVLKNNPVTTDQTALVESAGFEFLNLVTVTSADEEYSAINPITIEPTGAVSVVVVSQPANGTASVSGNVITYTPVAGFDGSDSFTYQIVDEAGATSTVATANVTVTNRAPVARVTGPTALVAPGAAITLSGTTSTDPDGDSLTYTWTRLSGPAIVLSTPTAGTTGFTVPDDAAGSSFRIQLTVSDGTSTNSTTYTVSVEEESSSGSFAFWLALLALPMALLRRRRVM